jgi:hypothetical protein
VKRVLSIVFCACLFFLALVTGIGATVTAKLNAFETGVVGFSSVVGTVTVQTDHVQSGNYSARATTTAAATSVGKYTQSIVEGDKLYMGVAVDRRGSVNFGAMRLDAGTASRIVFKVRSDGKGYVEQGPYGSPTTTLVGPVNLPDNCYTNVELHLQLSSVDGSALTEVYRNNVLVGSSTKPNIISGQTYSSALFGAASTTGATSVDFDRAYIRPESRGRLGGGAKCFTPTGAPPYDPDFVINNDIPAGHPDDTNSAAAVGALVNYVNCGNATGSPCTDHTKLIAPTGGEVPAVNVASDGDPPFSVDCNGCGIDGVPFNGPWPLALGSGSDHPVEVLDPSSAEELRVWRASICGTDPNILCGELGGVSYYNNDGDTFNPTSNPNECGLEGDRVLTGVPGTGCESLAQSFIGGGAGNGLTYLAGLIRPAEVEAGKIDHAIRVAYPKEVLKTGSPEPFRRPARKGEDSSTGTGTNAVEMGSIFQLDSSVDCDARTLPSDAPNSSGKQLRFLKEFCHAAQDKGVMVSDGTSAGNVTVYLEDSNTAAWNNGGAGAIGATCSGVTSYSWIIRPSGQNCGSNVTSGGTDGLPWTTDKWHLKSEPATYTSWSPP